MGNVKPVYIKRVALELYNKYPEEFNTDFDNNKKKVNDLTDTPTSEMRNKIAGYITRYVKKNMPQT